jgi:hypothetical protein
LVKEATGLAACDPIPIVHEDVLKRPESAGWSGYIPVRNHPLAETIAAPGVAATLLNIKIKAA